MNREAIGQWAPTFGDGLRGQERVGGLEPLGLSVPDLPQPTLRGGDVLQTRLQVGGHDHFDPHLDLRAFRPSIQESLYLVHGTISGGRPRLVGLLQAAFAMHSHLHNIRLCDTRSSNEER